MATQRWTVGDVVITRVLEAETPGIPPVFFFPDAGNENVQAVDWLVPDYAAADGTVTLAVQAFVVEAGGRRIVVDPCVGNGKVLSLPFWAMQDWPFWERFEAEGFDADSVDLVVHTHLHADHIGWGTRRVDGEWRPTFANARYLYDRAELEHRRANDADSGDDAYAESIEPVMAAGLAEVVDSRAEGGIDLGGGLRLEATPGHTPGHTSLWIESGGEVALVSGDFLHHPVQCARPDLAEVADHDVEQARDTRRRMLATAAERDALFVGTHFATHPAGRVVAAGDAFRFVPIP